MVWPKKKKLGEIRLPGYWYNNIICAIDINTTGLDPKLHDIGEVAIVPLDWTFKPINNIFPYNILIKPERLHNIDEGFPKNKLNTYLEQGYDWGKAAELLENWVYKVLKLPEDKKIIPLASNWPFDRSFLIEWLGLTLFDMIFYPEFRDTQVTAAFINDFAFKLGKEVPFRDLGLRKLARRYKIPYEGEKTALGDAMLTINVYRSLLGELYAEQERIVPEETSN
jgi:hypothetical protein